MKLSLLSLLIFNDEVNKMAGKLNYTSSAPQGNVLGRKTAKAYAEGRIAKIAGLLVTANPLPATSPDGIAWIAGWTQYNTAGVVQQRDAAAEVPKI